MLWSYKRKREPFLTYAPKDDITVWELAQAMKLIIAHGKIAYWDRMPKEVKRHFYVLEE